MTRHVFDMSRHSYDKVRVLIAEPDKTLRETIEQDLISLGFKEIVSTNVVSQVKTAVLSGAVDLLICDTSLKDGCMVEIIKNLRLGVYGEDIFPVVITLLSNPTKRLVHEVIDCGSDAILVKPVALETLHQRILELTAKRERFVVTSDYIGPDRRKKQREGCMVIPKTEVPNPLRNRVTGYLNDAEFQSYVCRVSEIINEMRIKRQSYHMGYLVEKIQPAYEASPESCELPSDWPYLVYTAKDLAHRVKSSRFTSVKGMTATLINFVDDIELSGALAAHDFRLLSHLTEGISRGCGSD